jgi:hypothetical protein
VGLLKCVMVLAGGVLVEPGWPDRPFAGVGGFRYQLDGTSCESECAMRLWLTYTLQRPVTEDDTGTLRVADDTFVSSTLASC